ncbi:MAG: trehalose-phosphatase [Rhodospirillales bacterium]|nr:trehalose-phosphatase [Rhodospirillales bacterium]
MNLDPLPPFAQTALLLDFDGTLVDLAPRPDAVVVAPGLVDSLRELRAQLQDALAIVTGRPIETVDALLGDAPRAVAGEHGGVVRFAPTAPAERPPLPAPPAEWLALAERLVAAYPGALLERKARGFALHYRAVPEAAPIFRDALLGLLAGQTQFQLLPAHMLWEIRPRGADKGRAVATLMQRPPFTGRIPVFIGDDVTDEDGMVVARQLGGAGYQVAPAFGTPAGVRAWLAEAARTRSWPALPPAAPGELP